MAGTYDTNDEVRLSAEFRNNSGVLADPSSVTFKIKLPDGTITSYVYGVDVSVVKDSVGLFHMDFNVSDDTGIFFYRVEGGGSLRAASESKFTVKVSQF